MKRIACNVRRTAFVLRDDDTARLTVDAQRRGIVAGISGDELFRLLRIRDDLFVGRAAETRLLAGPDAGEQTGRKSQQTDDSLLSKLPAGNATDSSGTLARSLMLELFAIR